MTQPHIATTQHFLGCPYSYLHFRSSSVLPQSSVERSSGFETEPGLCLCLEALKSHSRDAKRDRLSSHTSAIHVLDPFTIPPICMRKGPFCSTDSSEKRQTSGKAAAKSCSPQLEFICDRDRHDEVRNLPCDTHTNLLWTDIFNTQTPEVSSH